MSLRKQSNMGLTPHTEVSTTMLFGIFLHAEVHRSLHGCDDPVLCHHETS